jgi:hypothetical protein
MFPSGLSSIPDLLQIKFNSNNSSTTRYEASLHQISLHYNQYYIWFHILIPAIMKSAIVWDVTLCSLLEMYRPFGVSIFFQIQQTSTRLHGVISQKRVAFNLYYSLRINQMFRDRKYVRLIDSIWTFHKHHQFSTESTKLYWNCISVMHSSWILTKPSIMQHFWLTL